MNRTPEQMAMHSLELGNAYPYDEDRPCVDWAHSAARGVLADLSDRSGIKWELANVDDEVRNDIVDAVAAIIRAAATAKAEAAP